MYNRENFLSFFKKINKINKWLITKPDREGGMEKAGKEGKKNKLPLSSVLKKWILTLRISKQYSG